MEVKRQLDVLDRNLADRPFMIGDDYSIADMAIYPWYGVLVTGEIYNAQEFLNVASYEHVNRWAREIEQRPGVQRGSRVNRTWGDEDQRVPERHSAADFK
jgi:GST-like protein